MISLIDADSLFYIIGSNYKEIESDVDSIREVRKSIDSFVDSILTLTQANHYMGMIGNPDRKCFRHERYLYNNYKGNRPPDPDWLMTWRSEIFSYLVNEYGFFCVKDLEADDVIAMVAEYLRMNDISFTICSPDKDLKQIQGRHYDYKTSNIENAFTVVSADQAHYNLWLQVLMGDSTDNIAGIPGIGEVKAKKLLADVEPILYKTTTITAYCKYFGPYYGPLIFRENLLAVQLMCSTHSLFTSYIKYNAQYLIEDKLRKRKTLLDQPSIFE